jgi:hypothetical protein
LFFLRSTMRKPQQDAQRTAALLQLRLGGKCRSDDIVAAHRDLSFNTAARARYSSSFISPRAYRSARTARPERTWSVPHRRRNRSTRPTTTASQNNGNTSTHGPGPPCAHSARTTGLTSQPRWFPRCPCSGIEIATSSGRGPHSEYSPGSMDAGPATPRGVNRVGATSGAHQARFNAMTKSRARSAVIRSAHGTVHMFLAVAAVSWRPVTISSIDWAEVAAFTRSPASREDLGDVGLPGRM